uniref:Uncharacterized protein n=1 Tax=Avena sativa TaxID=4498 RepID=A0ACD5XIB2_AVESA
MSLRGRLLSLLRSAGLASAGRLAAAPSSRRSHLPPASAGAASSSGSESNDGNFSDSSNRRSGSSFGAILIGQAAVFLSLGNSVLAQDDSVTPAATTSGHADADVTSLRRIEDSSVISNEHTVNWRLLTNKAQYSFLKGRLDEAEMLFKAALHEAKEGFGPRDPRVRWALNNLFKLVSYTIFCFFWQRALKIEGRVMGPGHPGYANTMFLLAMVLSRERKGKDAEALARESIRILEEAGLGESPACIQRRMFLSNELVNLKQLAEAEILQRKILHTLELLKGWNSMDTAIAAENLGITLRFMGKVKESEELLERCLAVTKNILSEDHIQVASTLVHLANLTLISIISGVKAKNDLRRSHLVSGERLVNDSIRITQGILYTLREDGKKPNNAFAIERERIAATALLLEALRIVGLLDAGRISVQAWAQSVLF